jgi:hypothetical protein
MSEAFLFSVICDRAVMPRGGTTSHVNEGPRGGNLQGSRPVFSPVSHACSPRHGARCAQPRRWGRATGSEGGGEASANQGRVRIFDADVAVTYTAAGFTDAWQTALYGRDRRQPRAWLLDTCV